MLHHAHTARLCADRANSCCAGKMQTTRIGELSDGQQSRLVFAMICMKNPNLLLLDEPTNHLDIEAIDSLAEAIKGFKGGLVLVSHDFRLIDQVSMAAHHQPCFCVSSGGRGCGQLRDSVALAGEVAPFVGKLQNAAVLVVCCLAAHIREVLPLYIVTCHWPACALCLSFACMPAALYAAQSALFLSTT